MGRFWDTIDKRWKTEAEIRADLHEEVLKTMLKTGQLPPENFVNQVVEKIKRNHGTNQE